MAPTSPVPEPPGGAPDALRPPIPGDGWSNAERALLVFLLLGLVAVAGLRMATRRDDASRNPLRPDILVVHLSGLRADSLSVEALAEDLDLDEDELLVWENAYAPSSEGTRSALSLLEGDLALDLSRPPGADSLPRRLRDAGYRNFLFDDEGPLARAAGPAFDRVAEVRGQEATAEALAAAWLGTDRADPVFAFVHLGAFDDPLHADTTESYVLRERYRLRIRALRMATVALSRAATGRERPRLLVVAGASGLELGEHPAAPDRPYESQLRVPMLLALTGGHGLPGAVRSTMVQTTDLAPTLLDMLDLRDAAERDLDGEARVGVSLEPFVHGWTSGEPHDELYFVSPGHAAARTREWKLIAPVHRPWVLAPEGVELYSLDEDPAEEHDVLEDREMGAVAKGLYGRLGVRLARPSPAVAAE